MVKNDWLKILYLTCFRFWFIVMAVVTLKELNSYTHEIGLIALALALMFITGYWVFDLSGELHD